MWEEQKSGSSHCRRKRGGGQRVIAMGAVWELGGRGGAREKCPEMDKWGARRKEGDVRKRGRDASPW